MTYLPIYIYRVRVSLLASVIRASYCKTANISDGKLELIEALRQIACRIEPK